MFIIRKIKKLVGTLYSVNVGISHYNSYNINYTVVIYLFYSNKCVKIVKYLIGTPKKSSNLFRNNYITSKRMVFDD